MIINPIQPIGYEKQIAIAPCESASRVPTFADVLLMSTMFTISLIDHSS